jgi:ribosomal protein S16
MIKSSLQLDVMPTADENIVKIKIYFDGCSYSAAMKRSVYETMLIDGCFIRDGKTVDSAGVLNTTNVFYEKKTKNIMQNQITEIDLKEWVQKNAHVPQKATPSKELQMAMAQTQAQINNNRNEITPEQQKGVRV